MKAMVIEQLGEIREDSQPLKQIERERPHPGTGEVLIRLHCCGVCHTELDEMEGRTPPESLPRVPGHQAVGTIEELGTGMHTLQPGTRVGVAWIYSSCGECEYCQRGDDNLCREFQATGRDADGGYAEYMCAPAAYVFPLPDELSDEAAAPMLCAGAIGYRSLRLTDLEDGQRLGMTGFGASAHLMMKMIHGLFPNSPVYVFARRQEERDYALSLGAVWAGDTDEQPPELLHAIIDTTPAWLPIVRAMEALLPGGRLVINAIRKENRDQSELSQIQYETHLWMEKEIKTVANVSRRDVSEFLALAARLHIQPEVQSYPMEQANQAIIDMKFKPIRGAKVLMINP